MIADSITSLLRPNGHWMLLKAMFSILGKKVCG